MYSKIMVPVDLAHTDRLAPALDVAANLAEAHKAEVVYVGVTSNMPGAVARSPEEYADKLRDFAATQGDRHGRGTDVHVVVSHDPSVDLNAKLLHAIDETGSDLVVMASHTPGIADHWLHGHAAHVASEARVSVFVVR